MAQLSLFRRTQIPGVRIQRYINQTECCMLSREDNQQFKVILGYMKRGQKRVRRERMEGEGERGRLREAKASILSTKGWEINCVPQESIICQNLNSRRM